MKKYLIIIPVVALLALASYLIFAPKGSMFGSSATLLSIVDTTPYQLFPSGATKQLITQVSGADYLALDVKMTASTTASVLNWYYEFTNDDNCGFNATPADCSWYLEDGTTATSNILTAHSSTTLNHTWAHQSETASTTNKRILVNTKAKFIRTTFSTTGATSTILVNRYVIAN